jgi:phosphate transport system permease protein
MSASTPTTHPNAAAPLAGRPVFGGDRIFAGGVRLASLSILALLGAIILVLLYGGLPAFRHFGLGFLTTAVWNPVTDHYGALTAIFGTLVTAILSLLMAVPLAFGIAFFLTELAPAWLRQPIGTAVELLAAVPSIIFGMWGFFVVAPIMATTIQPFLSDNLGDVPIIGDLVFGAPYGTGIFTASLILTVMVLPFIAATMRDVFLTVPPVFKESAYGLGCTTWEVMRYIVLPYTKGAVVGGIMLGLGRALGETMAVTFVIGNANRISASLFSPGNTIASLIALEFPEAQNGSLRLASLLGLGFILMIISLITLSISRVLLKRAGAAG